MSFGWGLDPDIPVSSPASAPTSGGFSFGSLAMRVAIEHGIPYLLQRLQPTSLVQEADEKRAALEIRELDRQLSMMQSVGINVFQLATLLPRLTIILGAQHSGKSTLMSNLAWQTDGSRPVYWIQPDTVEKPVVLPPHVKMAQAPVDEPETIQFIDEAWMWYATEEKAKTQWLRQLYHSNSNVIMSSQSGAFLKPAIWRSGDCAVCHTGGNPISEQFEREEVLDLMKTLSSYAKPRERVAAYIQGVIYEVPYFSPEKEVSEEH